MAMTKLKISIVGVVLVAGLATLLVVQQQTQAKLREENESLRQQAGQWPRLSAENERLSNLVAEARSSLANDQLHELLRLRGQVGMLRDQTNELRKLREENRRLQASLGKAAPEPLQPETDPAAKEPTLKAKISDAKELMLAFRIHANENQGQFPTNFDQLPKTWIAATGRPLLTGTNQFEIVYAGSLHEITDPGSVIVVREKQAWQASDGNWYKVYGFDDGSAIAQKAADGNFDAWENQHMFSPPSQRQ
jgi:hypothetical protein